MTTIIAGESASFTVAVQQDGEPVRIENGDSLTARIFTTNGKTLLMDEKALENDAPGANWNEGTIVIELTAFETEPLPAGDLLLIIRGGFGLKRFRLIVEPLFESSRTSLFIRDVVIDEIRRDRLMAASTGVLQGIKVSDGYIWDKVRAAESELAHTLRVPLVPTKFFSLKPTQQQIDDLDGMAWGVDPAYDYTPDMFRFEKWGYFVTRQTPIISVDSMRFAYPSQNTGFVDIPKEWIRIDARYGHIRLVPSSPAIFAQMDAWIMTALTGNRSIPFMIQLEYTAGLEDVPNTYPELLDVIKKMAVLKIINDAYLPQSGSISADGLSQSISVDIEKYSDAIDHSINGPKGSNGGLMTKLHGIKTVII